MNLSFRPAVEDDIATISVLADKIWREHYPSIISVEQIDYMLKSRYSSEVIAELMKGEERFFLAFIDSEPVGYGSVELKSDFYYLHKFYIDVSRHRRGIGTEFFSYVLQQLDNSKPIRLQVNRLNFKAVNFYFKSGFEIESTGDFNIGNNYYMNDFVMIRKPGRKIYP